MVSKLVFKGDKKKKKSSKSVTTNGGISKPWPEPKRSSKVAAASTVTATNDGDDSIWTSAKIAAHITGPVVLSIVST